MSALVLSGVPSRASLVKALAAHRELLPAGVSVKFLAAELDGEIRATGPAPKGKAVAPPALDKIPAGRENASAFQREAFRILKFSLAGSLSGGRLEQPMDAGRKRYDIKFQNCADSGFFSRLGNVAPGACGRIVMECKNYTGDPKNPEFDQLAGRLGDRRKVGFLVCRKFKNRAECVKRASSFVVRSGYYIMLLNDVDLEKLYASKVSDKSAEIDRLLDERLDEISE